MNRRSFVKLLISSGSMGLLSAFLGRFLTACATGHGPKPPTADANPNFKGPGYAYGTFYHNIYKGYTPGTDYKIPWRTPIIASAKGRVRRINKKVIRAGGLGVSIEHGRVEESLSGVRDSYYKTGYLHLNKILVKEYEEVERGQIIGYAGDEGTDSVLKFTVVERDRLVNPNNYGKNYSLMDYWDGQTNLDLPDNEIAERYINQRWVVKNLISAYFGPEKDQIELYYHPYIEKRYGPPLWSEYEKFRYLENKFLNDPTLFEIDDDKFKFFKEEFYNNQPIIITFPFKKP